MNTTRGQEFPTQREPVSQLGTVAAGHSLTLEPAMQRRQSNDKQLSPFPACCTAAGQTRQHNPAKLTRRPGPCIADPGSAKAKILLRSRHPSQSPHPCLLEALCERTNAQPDSTCSADPVKIHAS